MENERAKHAERQLRNMEEARRQKHTADQEIKKMEHAIKAQKIIQAVLLLAAIALTVFGVYTAVEHYKNEQYTRVIYSFSSLFDNKKSPDLEPRAVQKYNA